MSELTASKLIASILALNREALVNCIKDFKNCYHDIIKIDAPMITIKCSGCGKDTSYKTFEDIPYDSVRCECGVWLIKYGEFDDKA